MSRPRLRSLTSAVVTFALAGGALVASTGTAQAAATSAEQSSLGTRSLARVLAADGRGFDHNARDFDVLDNAVRAVLAAKPKSAVAVLADGRVRLTAFAPTDAAFRGLVEDLTGRHYARERRVFTRLAGVAGIDTIESVLLYHVVPGATITYRQAKAADGARLQTALEGATLRVVVRDNGRIALRDADRDDLNPRVVESLRNINRGNRQIAHGINRVLRPIDL